METNIDKTGCLECGIALQGRSDKRFCGDICRTSFNNKRRMKAASREPEFLKTIPKIILNNYQILKQLRNRNLSKVKRKQLEQLSFNFKYITSTYLTKAGNTYYFCFDLGYLLLENDWILLVEQESQVS